MYQSHWGLQETPFRASLDPARFYESPTHEEALARLDFLVRERRRLGLLLGDPGSGKSLLLEVFARQCRRAGLATVDLSLLGLSPDETLWSLAVKLGLDPEPTSPRFVRWQVVLDQIVANRYQQLGTVLLLDDADQAPQDTFALVRRLAQCDLVAGSCLTIVLAARRPQFGRLGAALLEMVELRMDLERWDLADTQSYLQSALRRAGQSSPLFDASAVARLHDLAGGIPRRVSQLADLALLAGAGENRRQIDASTVETACQELGAVQV